jgi:hypothetical protein
VHSDTHNYYYKQEATLRGRPKLDMKQDDCKRYVECTRVGAFHQDAMGCLPLFMNLTAACENEKYRKAQQSKKETVVYICKKRVLLPSAKEVIHPVYRGGDLSLHRCQ